MDQMCLSKKEANKKKIKRGISKNKKRGRPKKSISFSIKFFLKMKMKRIDNFNNKNILIMIELPNYKFKIY